MSDKILQKLEEIEERLRKIEMNMAMFKGAKMFLNFLGIIVGIIAGIYEIFR